MHVDECRNSFREISSIQTDLLFGNAQAVQHPLITVIVPTYERDELLKEAIESVLRQEPVDFSWEFLVIDNSPFDQYGQTAARTLIESLGDTKILYYHNRENIGSGYNWNRGVELAHGRWVVLLHDDDVMLPDALKNIGRILNSGVRYKKPLGYIHANRVEFSQVIDAEMIRRHDKRYCVELTRTRSLLTGLTWTGMPSCGTAILKKAYCEAGGINYQFGPTADAVLGYQIMRNYTVIRSDHVLGGYRWSDNETLKKSTLQKLLIADELFADYRYRQSIFSACWRCLFGDVIRWRNVDWKVNSAKKGGLEVTPDELIPEHKIKEPNKIWQAIYSMLIKSYQIWHILKAFSHLMVGFCLKKRDDRSKFTE